MLFMNRFLGGSRSAYSCALRVRAGCGYVGDPLPPLANVPSPVTDLAAIQRGGRIIVQFTVPVKTTEGPPDSSAARNWICARARRSSSRRTSGRRAPGRFLPARRSTVAARRRARRSVPRPATRFRPPTGPARKMIFGVRAVAGNGKQSGMVEFRGGAGGGAHRRSPRASRSPPRTQGVRLTWQARGTDFRVFRKTGDDAFAQVASVKTPEWTDTATEFGKRYPTWFKASSNWTMARRRKANCPTKPPIVPRDVFPPAAPKGVQGSSAPNSDRTELGPEHGRGPERLPRISRRGQRGHGENWPMSPPCRAIRIARWKRGKTYRYSVTAVDQAGNESPRSAHGRRSDAIELAKYTAIKWCFQVVLLIEVHVIFDST